MELNREFTVDGKNYFIDQPTAKDIRSADWNYSVYYSKSLAEGIPTSSEMSDILKKRGIIGPEYDKRSQDLSLTLENLLMRMYSIDDSDEKRQVAEEASEVRNEIFQWNQRMNGPMSNTCEQIADDARLEHLTSSMILDDKKERVWNNYEEYLDYKDQITASRAKFEVMLYLQGLDSDFLEKVPETVTLKELNEKETDQLKEDFKTITEGIEKKEDMPDSASDGDEPVSKKKRRTSSKKKESDSKE